MNAQQITPLEKWVCRKIGLAQNRSLNRRDLEHYQLEALNMTLAAVRGNSPFYRRRFAALGPGPLGCLDDLAAFPFTSAQDIRRNPLAFLCVSRDRVARVVTLQTSGTTGNPKRLYFTEADLDLTVDFFHHGMSTLVAPGQRVLVLLPGTLPGSVGDLLVKGLTRMSVQGIIHGPVQDPARAIQAALNKKIDCLVGIPVQVLAMACHEQGAALAGQIRSILLSTDYVPAAIVSRLQLAWDCRVFKHYGMTEMGLGGAVECAAQSGYHFREADLLVEIIDSKTRQPVPDGSTGEIVFTTLTREGMPLVRYRSGDLAAIRINPCHCGTKLKTLTTVCGRSDALMKMVSGETLFMGDLDEAVFGVAGVVDYHVDIKKISNADQLTLWITIQNSARFKKTKDVIHQAVSALHSIRPALGSGSLAVTIKPAKQQKAISSGTGKRRIRDLRKRKPAP